MTKEPDPERLKALKGRIASFKDRDNGKSHQEEHYSQAQVAWRMVTELVAGLGLGFGIGYGLDILLKSTPWLMVTFTLLGFAAGVKTMMHTAQEVQQKQTNTSSGGKVD